MEVDLRIEEWQSKFDSLYLNHPDKKVFLKSEIEGYLKIFDENRLQISVLKEEDRPLEKYSIPYSSMQIFLIRELYFHFCIRNNDISEIEKDEWNSWIRNLNEFALESLSEPTGPKYYYYLARDLKKYLKWLEKKVKYSDKNYIWNDTIVDSIWLIGIFKKYGSFFKGETIETWLTRFRNEDIKIDSINVEKDAKSGTAKLLLIAILGSVQKESGNKIDFETFVRKKFGIRSYQSTKTKSKEKPEYKAIEKHCDSIFKIMT